MTNRMTPLRRLATVLDEGVVGVESGEMVTLLGGELATFELALDAVAVVDEKDVLGRSGVSIRSTLAEGESRRVSSPVLRSWPRWLKSRRSIQTRRRRGAIE